MGGAQAVAAMAYGTETVPQVDKIVGPATSSLQPPRNCLYGTVDIDMIAGPSEILVLADDSANPKYVAADLMSQAEHDRLASAIPDYHQRTACQRNRGRIAAADGIPFPPRDY